MKWSAAEEAEGFRQAIRVLVDASGRNNSIAQALRIAADAGPGGPSNGVVARHAANAIDEQTAAFKNAIERLEWSAQQVETRSD